MNLVARAGGAPPLETHRPLYERVPTRDEYGRPLTDFMLLLPGLRDRPKAQFNEVLTRLQAVLAQFHDVIFADLNLPLNLLWVSARVRPGVILELFWAVKSQLPEAKLVGHRQV